jgi:Ca-activated chloride channel family protein
LTAFTSFVAIDSQVVNAGGQGQSIRQPLPMPDGVSNLAVAEAQVARSTSLMGLLGKRHRGMEGLSGSGYGAGGVALAPPPAPAAAPLSALGEPRHEKKSAVAKHEVAELALDEEDTAPAKAASDKAVLAWSIKVDLTAGVRDPAPLVAAIRAALAKEGERGTGSVTVRLTVDAHGKVLAVDIVGGDKAFGARLKPVLLRLSSRSASNGLANGTVALTIRRG